MIGLLIRQAIRKPQKRRDLSTNSFRVYAIALCWSAISVTSTFAAMDTDEVTSQSESIGESSGPNVISSLPFHFSVFAHGGYDDNVLNGSTSSTTTEGSLLTQDGGTLTYKTPGNNPAVNLQTGGDITHYFDISSGKTDDYNAYGDFNLAEPVSKRLEIDAKVHLAYRTEPTFSANIGVENQRANYFETADTLSLAYQWLQRLSTVTTDTFTRVTYESSALGSFFDRYSNTIGESLRFSLIPQRTVLVGEYRFEIERYDSFSTLNSTIHYALVGIEESFNPQLRASIRGGLSFQEFQHAGSATDPYVDGSLTYSGAHHSSLTLNTVYSVEAPNSQTAFRRTTYRTGMVLSYGVSERISGQISGYYHHDTNEGFTGGVSPIGVATPGFSQDTFDVTVGLQYAVRRFLSVDLSFEHSEVSSGQSVQSFSDYSRNRVWGGITLIY
jgi:Putative beta-barrel porin 2